MDYVKELIALLVKPGQVCVDVGANIGETEQWMLDAGASNVTCIEPMPKWADALEQRLAGRSFELHLVGVADHSASGQWFAGEDASNPGYGGLARTGEFLVTLTTLDELLKDRSVNFMKIDVEGMELPVLRGAQEILKRDRPIVLYETRIEFEQAAEAPIFSIIADLLRGLGYSLFDYQDGQLCPTDGLARGWNTVALPQ
jgi:FkbM family methyltransferase